MWHHILTGVPLLPHKPKCPSLGSVRTLPSESTRQCVYHTVGKSAQVCACVCARMCACVYMGVHAHMCVYVHAWVHACVRVCACVQVCVFIPNTTVKLLYTGHKIPFLEEGGD